MWFVCLKSKERINNLLCVCFLSHQAWLPSHSYTIRLEVFYSLSSHCHHHSSCCLHIFPGIFTLQYTDTCKQTHSLQTAAAVENIHSLIRFCLIIFSQREFFLQLNSQKVFGVLIIPFPRQLPRSSSACYQFSQFCHVTFLYKHSLL